MRGGGLAAHQRRMARAVAVMIAFSAGALLGGCGKDAPDTASTTTGRPTSTSTAASAPDNSPAPEPTTSTFPPGSTEAQVAEAYTAAVVSAYARIKHPSPTDPSIDVLYTGTMRESVVADNQRMVDAGYAARFPSGAEPRVHISVIELDGPATARLDACYVDDTVIYEVATGETVDDDVSTWLMEATLTLSDGRWLLSDNLIREQLSGAHGCEEASN